MTLIDTNNFNFNFNTDILSSITFYWNKFLRCTRAFWYYYFPEQQRETFVLLEEDAPGVDTWFIM